ncbi:MAG: efflux RND transporter permease subunit [Planctomycetaceae bacterium]|nr:efflux RND transporter permease subunit [Planctomycetaceae bacterium]
MTRECHDPMNSYPQILRTRHLFKPYNATGVLLLYSDFQNMRSVLLIFLTLPVALVDGIGGAFLSGGVISRGSLIGFVTVFGVAVRNGIMLMDHYRHLQREKGVPFGPELFIRGAEERLAPILLTALTTGVALFPLLVTGNKPGQEIEYPMAFVIHVGLVTSTLLNLLVLPPLFAKFGHRNPPNSNGKDSQLRF